MTFVLLLCAGFVFQEDVLTTSYLTACYLQDIGFKKKVYIVGTSGISRELNYVGIRNIGVGVSNRTLECWHLRVNFD